MNFSTLTLALFALLANRIFCSSTYVCEVDNQKVMDKYLEETKIFNSKLDQITACGDHFNKGQETKRQNKYKKCIKKCNLPADYESGLNELTSSDFVSDKSMLMALIRVGQAYCKGKQEEFRDEEPDIERQTIKTVLNLKPRASKNVEEDDREANEEEEEEQEEGGEEEEQEEEAKFDGVFGPGKKEKNKKKKSKDLIEEKVSEAETPKTDIKTDTTPFYKSFIFLGVAALIAIIAIVLIIYFCMSGNDQEKAMPPVTPMKPMQPLEQVQQSIQQRPSSPVQPKPVQPLNQYQAQQYQNIPRQAQQYPPQTQQQFIPPQVPAPRPAQRQFTPTQQPQQFSPSSYRPPNFPNNNSQASLSSPGMSMDEPPPSYHDIHRPFQPSNPYSKR